MRKLVRAVILLLPSLALADPSAKQIALSEKLVELIQVRQMFATYQKECDSPENTSFDPTVAFRDDPGSFKGLSPQSTYWPEVVAIYGRFRETACAYASQEKFTNFFVDQYAEKLSEGELEAAIQFYSSPVGRRIQSAALDINGAFSGYANKVMGDAYELARARFQAEIHEVIVKYRKEPR
jgi:hypothetical protein